MFCKTSLTGVSDMFSTIVYTNKAQTWTLRLVFFFLGLDKQQAVCRESQNDEDHRKAA
jgi:hypothetical protein